MEGDGIHLERRDGITHILIDEDVSEMTAWICIAQASFALARPFLESWKEYIPSTRYFKLTDDAARSYFKWEFVGKAIKVLEMDEILGRKCATILYREGERHFILDRSFEDIRGLANGLVYVANKILDDPKQLNFAWNELMAYKGESLTLRLTSLGHPRRERHGIYEDDWTYRKRVFPHLFEKHEKLAWEFLLGRSFVEWDEYDFQYYYHMKRSYLEKEDREVTHNPGTIAAWTPTDPAKMRKLREKQYKEDK